MKNILLVLFLTTSLITNAQTIDAGDTVVFDLSGVSCVGNSFVVPVSFISDDSVYAIDFSMKYDYQKIAFNNVTAILPNVNPSAYFNPADSTLRFSSFSMWAIPHDTPVVLVQFDVTVSTITENDFNTIHVYLNGDTCSYKIIPPSPPVVITAGGPLTIVLGDSVALTASDGNGFTYLWSTNDTTQTIYVSMPGTYAVSVATAGGCVSADSVTVQMSISLPVELIYFSAKQENGEVNIEWSSASETNNDYFEVERSTDLSSWSQLERIEGAGNTSALHDYSTTDRDPRNGINYYRLKQVDFDGSVTHSETATIYFSSTEMENLHCSVFPNPAADLLHIISTDSISLQLYDPYGKMIICSSVIFSNQHIVIDTKQLQSGIYIARIFDAGELTILKNIRVDISR